MGVLKVTVGAFSVASGSFQTAVLLFFYRLVAALLALRHDNPAVDPAFFGLRMLLSLLNAYAAQIRPRPLLPASTFAAP